MSSLSRESVRSVSQKTTLALVLALIIPFTGSAAPAMAAGATSGCDLASMSAAGDGLTEATAWQISNPDQLWEIADCSGAFFKITQDIDARDATVATSSPIGTDATSPRDSLIGVLDGGGFEISFSMSISGFVGLFNKLGGATVKNLTLRGNLSSSPTVAGYSGALARSAVSQNTISNVVIESNLTVLAQTGGFIGQVENDSRVFIENSSFNGSLIGLGGMSGGSAYLGGFIGRSIGPLTIRNSTSSGLVSSSGVQNVGGFVGIHEVDPIELADLHRSSDVIGSGDYVGGVWGAISATSNGTISRVVNEGDVTATSKYVGGVGGFTGGIVTFTDVRNSGQVSGLNSTGGITGRVNITSTVSMITVDNSGPVTGSQYVGGLAGEARGNLLIEDSRNSGPVTGSLLVGGLVGSLGQSGTTFSVMNSENTGRVHTFGSVAGGALGGVEVALSSAIITGFTNSGQVSSGQNNIGGVVGFLASPFSIISSSNTATISAVSSGAGGAVGQVRPTAHNLNVIRGFSNQGPVRAANTAGGIVGAVLATVAGSGLQISRAINHATVESLLNAGANAKSGGLVGNIGVSSGYDLYVEISQSANLSTVSATWMPNVGGLVAVIEHSTVTVDIFESYNSGLVVSPDNNVGGLVGLTLGTLNISNSYNVGVSSGNSNIGGLVGAGNSNTSIHSSYFGGTLIYTNTVDGLVGNKQSYEISSSYTITASTLASTSAQVELQTLSTYVGWDFNDVWSFGACQINNEFPVLQWAEQLYFDLSCLTPAPSVSNTASQVSTPANSATPATYDGPVITNAMIFATAGTTFRLEGPRLQTITEVYINEVLISIQAREDGALILLLPEEMSEGVFDIVIFSAFGKLTVMDGISISTPVTAESFGLLLGYAWAISFTGNSRDLGDTQEAGIADSIANFTTATTIVCWGYTTAANPNDWAMSHATERAEAVCDLLAQLNPEVKTFVRVRTGVSKFAAMRSAMQFWELKATE